MNPAIVSVFRLGFLSLFLFVFSCTNEPPAAVAANEGRVVAIADGDTFTLLTDDKRQVKVRLHGIDCPEKKQDFGQVARQRLSELVFDKRVRLNIKDTDRYGRTVAVVYQNNACINEELLKEGLAWHYTRYDRNPEWERLEKEARRHKAGLWRQPHPTPPWEWRKEH